MTVAQEAFKAATDALNLVSGPGIDLVADDPGRARDLLNTAYQKLDEAQEAGAAMYYI